VRELDLHDPDVMPGMGVRFTELARASIEAIHTFMVERDPMFFPDR
jgi:hypothetical protein